MKKWETALLSFRHPEHSRGIFFVCRFLFPVYIHLHETPCFQVVGSAVFPMPPSSHIAYRTANEKDFSLPLEMTMRESGTLPPSHGRRCPEGAEVGSLPKRDEKMGGAPYRTWRQSRHFFPQKNKPSFTTKRWLVFLQFYNVRPISTAICLSLSGERPAMVR